MEHLLNVLLNWVELHPNWAGVTLMLTTAMESFLVVGLFVPGVAIMFGVGAMVASGHLPLATALTWSVGGAIFGDGTSYLIGHHFHQRLRVVWPFNRHPEMLMRGIDFFHRHGGKSVFLARFVGPMRALVPAIAGMVDMPLGQFFIVDTLSASVWVPLHMIPGLIFGASLGLAAEAAGRLALLIGLVVAVVWFSWWLVHRLARGLQPHATALQIGVLEHGRRYPRLYPLAAALLDPEHPEARGVTLLALLLIGASLVFLLTLRQFTPETLLGNLDLYFNNLLQDLRTTWGDRFFGAVTQLGRSSVLYLFTALASLWLVSRHHWSAALHWLITVASVGALTQLLKHATAVSRPVPELDAVIDHAFPSAHTSVATAVFGFLAVLVARDLRPNWRWIPYSLATLCIVLISFSRLYLAAHWFSNVVGGLSLGLAWVALMGIAFRRHPAPALPLSHFLPVVLGASIVAALFSGITPGKEQLSLYTPQPPPVRTLERSAWLARDWRTLPPFRNDLKGNHTQPLNLQWAGNLEEIKQRLAALGWEKPHRLNLDSLVRSFTGKPSAESLPMMPQTHDGREQVLMRYRATDEPDRLLALRLWRSGAVIGDGGRPLWIGTLSYLEPVSPMFLFTLLRTAPDFDAPLEAAREHLPDIVKATRRSAPEARRLGPTFLLATD